MTVPGSSQRRVRRSRTSHALAVVVAALAVLLLVDIVLGNPPTGAEAQWPWRLRLIGAEGTSTLLGAAFLGLIGQWQYAESNRAGLVVTSQWVVDAANGHPLGNVRREVVLKNTGKGPATIVQVSFEKDGAPTALSLQDVKAQLASPGDVHEGVDYVIENVTPGASIAQDGELLYFACSPDVIVKFSTFRLVVRFETALRDVYEKRALLVPYDGAAPPPPPTVDTA